MSVHARDPGDALELAVLAYHLIGVDIRPLLERCADSRLRVMRTTQRLVASGYDAEDVLGADDPQAWRCEVFALARALRALDEDMRRTA